MARRIFFTVAAIGLLSVGYLLGLTWSAVTVAGPVAQQQTDCQTFKETGKAVCGRFLKYWQEHGGLAQQGFPISGEFQEKSDLNGQTYTVQYFERAVFEYHPENQPPYDVLLSQLGTFEFKRKYPNGAPGAQATPAPQPSPTATASSATPTAPPPSNPVTGGVGDVLTRAGLAFTVTRVDRGTRRLDVIYQIRNTTSSAITLRLADADQQLITSTGPQPSSQPDRVINITLQPGQTFDGATGFNGISQNVTFKTLIYRVDNLPRLGSVQVDLNQ
ncbi:MAG: hypothetical protein IVW55_16250 [Chloroflexi bacterium]|nr:hypothetical protein [Chloroflexota bacterium]